MKNTNKVVIIGGTGILGTELKRINKDFICLDSKFDIFEFADLKNKLNEVNPDIIVNCAAIKSEFVDINPSLAINVNIIGSANISKYCLEKNKRLIYISTDYVYPGTVGNYSENDFLYPQNNYSWTKLAGESSTKLVNNHLIIRTSFGANEFPYKKAYANLFSSKDYVDVIAPMIVKAIFSPEIGVINIGTKKKSIYDYASGRNLVDFENLKEKKDFSLNITKYNNKIKNKIKNDN